MQAASFLSEHEKKYLAQQLAPSCSPSFDVGVPPSYWAVLKAGVCNKWAYYLGLAKFFQALAATGILFW